ncbi:hypothetical protein Glove_166g19 [Diversispora epigaea]|uniref:TLDc domain-containing protein n=1 Tax=Diversispora epigaea TaxID=1348612 RepID=A0A397IZK5_9GLOM|nr:hypothetical protein Glove_166g19 [Diversispora epigaea]
MSLVAFNNIVVEILDTLENNDSNPIHSTEHWVRSNLSFRSLVIVNLKLSYLVPETEHEALISSWIDRKESIYELNSIPYEFKLISRGSRDGKTRQAFKDRCTEQFIGGYNPKQWNSSGQWLVTNDCFIFSLGTGRDLQNEPILSRVANPYVIVHQFMIVWVFGCGDLHIIEGSCVRKDCEREIINSTTFTNEDFEVFKIIRIH